MALILLMFYIYFLSVLIMKPRWILCNGFSVLVAIIVWLCPSFCLCVATYLLIYVPSRSFYQCIVTFSGSLYSFWHKMCFTWYEYSYFCSILFFVYGLYLFWSFHF
jgi:hypothetical protein